MKSVSIVTHLGWREPVEVLAAFADEPHAIAFLSGGGGERARWSYLARNPQEILTLTADPAAPNRLAALLGDLQPAAEEGPPFQGGLAGLASYEFGEVLDPVGLSRTDAWPDLECGLYLSLLAFDHQERRVLGVGRGDDAAQARARAQAALAWLDAPSPPAASDVLGEGLQVLTPRAIYRAGVVDVIARIAAGEIFQVNIARRWSAALKQGATPYDLISRLALKSPAPFAGYLRLAGRAVASNSPERFLSVRGRDGRLVVETRPIKGTRPRGRTPAEDTRLAAELSASAKDRAENLMIVDLMRNDLSRVCDAVRTPEVCKVESFTNVHHLVSTVVGDLAPGLTGLDVFLAAFPPGSVTGAPKIQAMKVIAGLEPPRGPYCGALFWAGFDGAFDSSVLIRTAALIEDAGRWRLEARAGAGIVADSDPDAETLETEDKIAAILGALEAP